MRTEPARSPIPVRPIWPSAGGSLAHAAYAIYAAGLVNREPLEMHGARLDSDRHAIAILRAATTGITTGNTPELVGQATTAFFEELIPVSAAARLMPRGVRADLDAGSSTLTLNMFDDPPATLPWIAEDAPIPFAADPIAPQLIGPVKKMATIVALSYELQRLSNAEQIFINRLRRRAGLSLDAAYFGNQPASASAVAGLLFGVVATRPQRAAPWQ